MRLSELLVPGGSGIIATADGKGTVNTAMYAAPHIVDEETVAWGMTPGRTYDNLRVNRNASYLYKVSGNGIKGVRLTLVLQGIEGAGTILDKIKARAAEAVGARAAEAVRYVAYFKVVEARPLM